MPILIHVPSRYSRLEIQIKHEVLFGISLGLHYFVANRNLLTMNRPLHILLLLLLPLFCLGQETKSRVQSSAKGNNRQMRIKNFLMEVCYAQFPIRKSSHDTIY